MKVAVLAVAVMMSMPAAAGAQPKPDRVAEAYTQYLLAHRLEENDDEAGAVAAYKRAMELDPTAADIPGALAAAYLRQDKIQDAMTYAEQAVKITPANREGNRVLGIIYAALAESSRGGGRGRPAGAPNAENLAKAIQHLELAIAGQGGEADPNVRATLARAYMAGSQYDKAIPLLTALVNEQ